MTAPPVEPAGPAADAAHDDGQRRRAHRKLLAAGLIGSSIEWYDFFLYGTAAALVFPAVFFPDSSALMGTLLSFSTFWAGFVARPLGGVLAGHFGDKYGRKPAVVTCLLGMGLATFLIGCLPGAHAIGVAAPILLVTLRFLQGMACGGQWGGIVLLLTESASPKRRGFAGTFGQMGVPLGVILGNLVFLIAAKTISEEAFLSWGWRVPFFCSALLFPVVLYIQTKVEDTPEFRDLHKEVADKRSAAVAQAPLAEAIRLHWRKILLGCGLLAATNTAFYISIAGVLSYGTQELGMKHNDILAISLVVSLLGGGVILWSGAASDRVGRRPLILIGGIGLAVWAFPYFWLVDTAKLPMFFIALAVGTVFQSMTYGPLAAFMGELFEPRLRYSGASLAYQLAAITVSGGTPFIMTALIANTGSTVLVSVYLAAMGLVTVFSAWVLQETNSAAVRADPQAVPGEQLYR
ncbi:MFS transporter [Nocardia cyriacigeorgica]|uniref:MFS transporter n=1 Tax=Nocardia cyriacigeorgica TaxID=135487 RepID=UPI001895AEC7|nr:MFS transporter [Nocardia cyriacigeorgica]MBF6440285.1 MHS family MFS transporter [Nocardia cyriacigeorgica]MBF6457091.1 MHS family MFS transporter [Nocardia cyriacigeorgica]MBF6480772.1 MHS family MFS transporter [Nocardia cyriacigeorgica]MBF6554248.1 MHS family MFS transporter [Nocardia cyriacigeorgica]